MTAEAIKFVIIGIVLVITLVVAVIYVAQAVMHYDKRELNSTKRLLRESAYILVRTAETLFDKPGSGQEKYKYVSELLYKRIPKWATKFITEEDVNDIIEAAVARMKKYFKAIEQPEEVEQTEEVEQSIEEVENEQEKTDSINNTDTEA